MSVGADGVVFIENSSTPGVDFKWDFYNADGSEAEMCGNASRCVARYALQRGIGTSPLNFETKAGVITARILDGLQVEVELPAPKILERDIDVVVGEHIKIKVDLINSGVPHAVRESEDWEDEYLDDMGRYLRNLPHFQKYGGANATFYEVKGANEILSATFERGVEGITMACGTGAVAAATAAILKEQAKSPVMVHVPGGTLIVSYSVGDAFAMLSGEARFVCEGHIFAEALL
jgi:diaminopimelate epimerase